MQYMRVVGFASVVSNSQKDIRYNRSVKVIYATPEKIFRSPAFKGALEHAYRKRTLSRYVPLIMLYFLSCLAL